MPFGKIIFGFCENRTKHINTAWTSFEVLLLLLLLLLLLVLATPSDGPGKMANQN